MIKISKDITVYQLLTKHPELKATMIELGFDKLTQKGVLETMGRLMTLKKGARYRKVSWDKLSQAFKEKGYQLEETT